MTKKIIVANWKLNPPTLKEAMALAAKINRKPKHKTILCPPTAFLARVDYPVLGAQDCFWQDKGPFTGQTSLLQLKSLKVKYVIVGHSEKRATGETDDQINRKILAAIKYKLIPILCVGFGTKVEQDDLEVVDVLKQQLDEDLAAALGNKVIVAYEPVWAISAGNPYATKKLPTPEHAEKVALFIKARYAVKTVLYGGSVNVFNAKKFLYHNCIDGLLVGGDSLLPKHFNQIINQ